MTLPISHSKDHRNHLRTYRRADSVIVFKTRDPFGQLSNMASGFPLLINGIRILSTEALYQACRFPHLPDVQQAIIGQFSPMTAKMKSKPHRKNSRPDWEFVRVNIMRWCLRVKLVQNRQEFGRILLATKDRPIVEQSRKDDYWGAKIVDDDLLLGENVLGRLLMELRDQLRNFTPDDLQQVKPLDIPNFQLLGKPIHVVKSENSWRKLQQTELYLPHSS